MNLKEAAQFLRGKDASRSYCVKKQQWAHAGYENIDENFEISALPGIGGITCSGFSGPTIEAVLQATTNALWPEEIPTTGNEE